jgi:tetratricopeptide (TPR) repeat protein
MMMSRFVVPTVVAMSLLVAGCGSKKTVDEYLAIADAAAVEKDFESALANLDALVENHPDDTAGVQLASYKAAEIAWVELDDRERAGAYLSDVTVRTLYDAAEHAQAEGRPLLAVAAYEMLMAKTPETPDAEKAMFMKGFVLSEQIKDVEGAKAVFAEFMEVYPESELFESAKFMFETAGNDSLALALTQQ